MSQSRGISPTWMSLEYLFSLHLGYVAYPVYLVTSTRQCILWRPISGATPNDLHLLANQRKENTDYEQLEMWL
jgi:hypothetical protein